MTNLLKDNEPKFKIENSLSDLLGIDKIQNVNNYLKEINVSKNKINMHSKIINNFGMIKSISKAPLISYLILQMFTDFPESEICCEDIQKEIHSLSENFSIPKKSLPKIDWTRELLNLLASEEHHYIYQVSNGKNTSYRYNSESYNLFFQIFKLNVLKYLCLDPSYEIDLMFELFNKVLDNTKIKILDRKNNFSPFNFDVFFDHIFRSSLGLKTGLEILSEFFAKVKKEVYKLEDIQDFILQYLYHKDSSGELMINFIQAIKSRPTLIEPEKNNERKLLIGTRLRKIIKSELPNRSEEEISKFYKNIQRKFKYLKYPEIELSFLKKMIKYESSQHFYYEILQNYKIYLNKKHNFQNKVSESIDKFIILTSIIINPVIGKQLSLEEFKSRFPNWGGEKWKELYELISKGMKRLINESYINLKEDINKYLRKKRRTIFILLDEYLVPQKKLEKAKYLIEDTILVNFEEALIEAYPFLQVIEQN